jgi:hypothetical protein
MQQRMSFSMINPFLPFSALYPPTPVEELNSADPWMVHGNVSKTQEEDARVSSTFIQALHTQMSMPRGSLDQQVKECLEKASDSEGITKLRAKVVVFGGDEFVGYHIINALARMNKSSESQYKGMIEVVGFASSRPRFTKETPIKNYREVLLWQKHKIQLRKIDICDKEVYKKLLFGPVASGEGRRVKHRIATRRPELGGVTHIVQAGLKAENTRTTAICEQNFVDAFAEASEASSTLAEYIRNLPVVLDLSFDPLGTNLRIRKTMTKLKEAWNLINLYKETYDLNVIIINPSLILFGQLDSSNSLLRRLSRLASLDDSDRSAGDSLKGSRPFKEILESTYGLSLVPVTKLSQALAKCILGREASVVTETLASFSISGSEEKLMKIASIKNLGLTLFELITSHQRKRTLQFPKKDTRPDVQSTLGEKFTAELSDYVDWFLEHTYPNGIVLSSYFAMMQRPNGKPRLSGEGEENYISTLRRTAHLFNLMVYVWHNGLRPEFILDWETERFQFLHTDYIAADVNKGKSKHIPSAPNDLRFLYFFHHMRRVNSSLPQQYRPSHTLLTDINDVRFRKNPWNLMRRETPDRLFIGKKNGEASGDKSLQIQMRKCNFTEEERHVANAGHFRKQHSATLDPGVIGGSAGTVANFCRHLLRLLERTKQYPTCTVPAVNYVAKKYFASGIFYSHATANSDIFIVHR